MGNVEQTELQHMLERIEYLEKENRYHDWVWRQYRFRISGYFECMGRGELA
jgi:hypothetical protein